MRKLREPKLVYSLIRNGKNIVFTIYYMDERFRSDSEVTVSFTAKNGINILSCANPELRYPSHVYLRGGNGCADDNILVLSCSTKKEAKEFVTKVHEALNDWSENWEGFKDRETETSDEFPGAVTLW